MIKPKPRSKPGDVARRGDGRGGGRGGGDRSSRREGRGRGGADDADADADADGDVDEEEKEKEKEEEEEEEEEGREASTAGARDVLASLEQQFPELVGDVRFTRRLLNVHTFQNSVNL